MCIHIFMHIWSLAQKWKAAHHSRCNKSSSLYNRADVHKCIGLPLPLKLWEKRRRNTAKENEAMVLWNRKIPFKGFHTCDMKNSNSERQNCRLMQVGSHLVQVPAPSRASYNSWSSACPPFTGLTPVYQCPLYQYSQTGTLLSKGSFKNIE